MQSLYSYLSVKSDNFVVAEKSMLKHFNEVVELKFVLLSLLVELVKYADIFYEEGKKKHLPSIFDLNPNKRFVNNEFILSIKNNKSLMHKVSDFSFIWLKNDHDIIAKVFTVIIKSELYAKYLSSDNITLEYDKKFIIDVMSQHILNNQLVQHILEERSIYWIDDLPFIATIIFGNIKSDISMLSNKVFKDISDKDFALSLFKNVIINNTEYENIIVRFSENWELDRIAKMDQLILKMAFSEIISIPELPTKVSMNEYIEISKYYSTLKSRNFVNGVLDNFVRTYTKEGKIRKYGRGLI